MADGRRTRWVAHDVYFLDEGLGQSMFERFGGVGVALWHGFIAACKKNHIEGQTSWSSDVEALTVFGLPGMPLVDLDGEPFKLDDWLDLLSDHKVIRRHQRGRRLKVTCTKWDRWQSAARKYRKAVDQAARRSGEGGVQVASTSPAGGLQADNRADTEPTQSTDRPDAAQQTRRSEHDFTATVPPRNGHDVGPKQAQMTDTDTDTEKTLASGKPTRPRDLIFEALVDVCGLAPDELTKSARGRVNVAAKELRDIGASPDGIRARARVHRTRWPNAELTPTSLATNYAQLGSSGNGRADVPCCPKCNQQMASHDDDICELVEAQHA